jgi:hypothetical protein
VDRAGQAGGCNNCTTSVPESLNDFCRPWNKNTPKETTYEEGKPYTNQEESKKSHQELL